MVDSFALPHIQLAVDVDPVHAEARTLKNCALMVNELLTNACKYAFPGQEAGAITVRLARLGAAFDVQSDASGTRATWTFDAPVPAQGRPV